MTGKYQSFFGRQNGKLFMPQKATWLIMLIKDYLDNSGWCDIM